jgi:hypothetical protein
MGMRRFVARRTFAPQRSLARHAPDPKIERNKWCRGVMRDSRPDREQRIGTRDAPNDPPKAARVAWALELALSYGPRTIPRAPRLVPDAVCRLLSSPQSPSRRTIDGDMVEDPRKAPNWSTSANDLPRSVELASSYRNRMPTSSVSTDATSRQPKRSCSKRMFTPQTFVRRPSYTACSAGVKCASATPVY